MTKRLKNVKVIFTQNIVQELHKTFKQNIVYYWIHKELIAQLVCHPMHYNQMAHAYIYKDTTCLDTNPNYCTSCIAGEDKIALDGICVCKPKYGLLQQICEPCSTGFCFDCQPDDFYSCISCKPASNRIVVNKECVCQPNSFDPENFDQKCIVCDITCQKCNGPSYADCTECIEESISNRIQVANLCPCKSGYGEFAIREAQCGKCHPKCETCFQAADDTDNQYCLTCIPGQNREVSDNFNCDCKENYGDFGVLEVCALCHYTCGACNGVEATNCIQCSISSSRELTTLGECLCKQSYYDDNTGNIVCQRCHNSCVTCANSIEKDACLECPSSRTSVLSGSYFECVCTAPNTFDDGSSLECQQCDQTCQTCYGSLSSNCLTCDKLYRQSELSSCVCPPEYYDIGQLECAKCHYSCYKCFDEKADSCIVCSQELSFRIIKGNICKCIDGYYEEPGISQCQKCSYKCEKCDNKPDQCLSCPLNSKRAFDPIKGCPCPSEYFDKEDEINCQKCHFKCKTCYGKDQTECLSCDSSAYRELQTSSCLCQPHYFEIEFSECGTCRAFCYECTQDSSNCTSCYSDRYLVGNTCNCITKQQGATISMFEYNGMIKCEKCHYSCGTCKGISEQDCITCIDTENRFQIGNTCVCKGGYFDAGLPICQKCSYKCKECSQNADSCISCQDTENQKFSFNKCLCMERYFEDGQNEVCQKCHYSCLRCNDIDTKCELCSKDSNRTYDELFFSCNCNIGYYDNGVETCQQCHYSCLSCNSQDSNSCISCVEVDTSNRVFYNQTCKCLFGYFDDGQSISCQKCDIQCLNCIQQSYICLSCPQTRKIETNCKCQQGYYEVGAQYCLECNSNCMTCLNTAKNCTSCDSIQFREINLKTRTCDCLVGFIEVDGTCQQCNQKCETCSQVINECTSCVKYRYLKDKDCICINGMYESNDDKQCKLCSKICLTCVNQSDYCLTCSIANFRQFKTGNTCECIQGYYENPINQNCEQCASSCLTCSLIYDNCLTCNTSLNLFLVNNRCLCQQSYYFDAQSNSCLQCSITCLECQNSSQCVSCRLTTRYFDEESKQCLCKSGFYEQNQQNCAQCDLTCQTCENTNTNCITCTSEFKRQLTANKCLCIDGYYEAGIETCYKCNNLCKTCQFSPSNCLKCFEVEQNRLYQDNKCLCKPGYFEQNTEICSKCSSECLTCKGSANLCTSCDIDAKRIDQSIIHKCPCISGFYQDQEYICQKCHIKCQSCVNQSDKCLSCNFALNANRKPLSGQCDCKEGYFDDGTQIQCQKCNFNCKTCVLSANNCQICQNKLRTNPPTCNCIDGYYEDEQFTCQICSTQCNTCEFEPSNSLTCKPGRIDKDCKCIDGYFEIGQIICQQCAHQCATCHFDPLNCKTCRGNRIQEPFCICQTGYFDDQLNENCQKCDSTCLECNVNGCQSCFGNRLLNDENDCIPPPNSISYETTPWCSTCQVAIVNAFLSDDLSNIIIHFDFPLNPKSFTSQLENNKCYQLFELVSMQTFGYNPTCFINSQDNQELLIQLGENPNINVGDEILFKSNSISHLDCETALQQFFFTQLQSPIHLLPPRIEFNVPLHKLNPNGDNSIYLKQIQYNGNRKLNNIIWTYELQQNEANSELAQFLDSINFRQEIHLFIPKFTLPTNAAVKFKIEYQNFIHTYSYSEFKIQTHSGKLPQIDIKAKPSYFVYENIKIGVSVGSLEELNATDKPKYQVHINDIDVNPKSSSSSKLNTLYQSDSCQMVYTMIQKYALSPNSNYTFQVTATNLKTSESQVQNFTIGILSAGLLCQFNNQGYQNIQRDLNLQIFCQDLDYTYKWNNDPDLLIQVACKDLLRNNNCQDDRKQTINVNKTETFQFIRKNSISPFSTQEWTVTASKFQQTSKFTLVIIYLDDEFPFQELEFNKGYLMRKINNYEKLNFTFLIPFEKRSQLLELSIAIIYDYEIIEILQPKYQSHQFKIFNYIKELKFGNNINLKFSAQYTNNIMPNLQNLKLSINFPPKCSKLIITRSSDLALTNFLVTAVCELSNDSPYKFQLRLFLRESDLTEFLKGISDNSLTFFPFQDSNQFSIQTPSSMNQSKIGILVQVLDNGGSVTNIFEKIIMKSAAINCTLLQFQNLNLQNKILLLFETLNQKCDWLHSQIYLDLLSNLILQDNDENTLKFQAVKLYKQLLVLQKEPDNRLLKETIQTSCLGLNSNHLYITSNSTQSEVNLTLILEELKNNIHKLDLALKYYIKMKNQFDDELKLNQYIWDEETFQKYENQQYLLITLLYYLDDVYSYLSSINLKNETINQAVNELLRFIPQIAEETQNMLVVNEQPLIIIGKEIAWQIKRTTKAKFNQQFKLESIPEDFLIDFIQYESTYFKTNPLRFINDLKYIQTQLNDQTIQVYPEHYYLINLKNAQHNRYLQYENFSSIYGTKFGSYQICQNNTELLSEQEIMCAVKTISGMFSYCDLSELQKKNTIELTCECNKFGDIFLITSTKFNKLNSNDHEEISDINFAFTYKDVLALRIGVGSLSVIFLAIYIFQLKKDYKDEQDRTETEQSSLNSQNVQDKNNYMFQGCTNVFKEKFQQIHQIIQ
ncbi:unnamed protein product [Paramecium octaurelia]|uniref:EGF-like domain-containing protein n=1 Tax=Paramecium octaurelia TaxID=43137 RepID=A0A8S1X2Y4_PAROT|nr:unnamed protein product [Paramecium octaurelia]